MKRKVYGVILIIILSLSSSLYSQVDKERIGTSPVFTQTGGYYNFGDKEKVNIDVSVWGYVRFAGKYTVPKGTTLVDIMSYSGGPITDAKLEEVRLIRVRNDSLQRYKDLIYVFNYNDLMWKEHITDTLKVRDMELMPGDIIIVPGEPRMFFRDNLSIILSITTTLISLAILIISIARK
ncbi:MAG: SLBB domain-containing protein [Ignavibacteria bacterium]